MSEDAVREIRSSAGSTAIEGVDFDAIDADRLLRQSHMDLAERAKPGTPIYPVAFLVIAVATGLGSLQVPMVTIIELALITTALWRAWAIKKTLGDGESGTCLRLPMLASNFTYGAASGWLVALHGFEAAPFLALLSAGVFSVIGSLLASTDRRSAVRFLIAGTVPIMLGVAWDMNAPRGALLLFVVALTATTFRLVAAFGREYWRQLIATALINAQKKELEVARSGAEEAGRMRDDLVRNFTHELRTPMNGVIGILQLAHVQTDPEERKELLAVAEQSAKTMLDQVNRVLDIETPHLEQALRPRTIRPRIFFESWGNRFHASAIAKGLKLKLRVNDDIPPELLIDDVRLRSIVTNLLDNAIKFTDEGRVDVFVYGIPITDSCFRLGIAVRDTGPGVPEEFGDAVFEPYRQLDPSVTRAHGGLGIGLAIVKMQAQLLGGTVDLNSEVGEGSTFRVEVDSQIPLAPLSPSFDQNEAEAEPAAN
jgi:signal transduction histidine kinase